jgi:putative FmdB family regulatory protein
MAMSPVYVWRCATCGEIEERHQTGFDPITPRCLKCGPFMQRVITAPGIVLKGDGWATKEGKGE